MNFYNEPNPFAAAWLRELIKQGHIADGIVDQRSIEEIETKDLSRFTQCHFFAGIGGWAYALRLAGWEDDRPVWTGSPPCQPFSKAGKKKAAADSRHLWPEFFRLIQEFAPSTIFGEQVAGPLGRRWLLGVRLDLEALGYGLGCADLPACSVGAPHMRHRLFWVAHSECIGRQTEALQRGDCPSTDQSKKTAKPGSGSPSGFWDEFESIACADGKRRRIKPGLESLADGVPGRVELLRGYGNAIVPQVASVFVEAFLEGFGVSQLRNEI